ncbi:polysaccharide deacetylase family protein [Pacificimonas sp. WHA3]|uniref:Polysaccharide deacetylase family protein n=1 Tax=Pacificimonas pallii TaxID=2827236 RepID=A0ABS6SEP8_9SPHN|nr:polysaccharide deacetylase family protein [Pacificimonas pallii]MBV7256883.1 polysaccharide deacetylase family protein [Pacificimonas pallii]
MFAPRAEQYIRFPDTFGQRFLIFVDTEEEFDWSQPRRRDATDVKAVRALPEIHNLMRSYGAKPAYLVDYPVATDPDAIEVLSGFQEDGGATIGAQLHPWVNPPFIEKVVEKNSFPGNLPKAVERAKIEALSDAIEKGFGNRPLVYRAGRYGVGPNTEALLDELGFRLDVSVRPFFDYSDSGGPSFRGIEPMPYWTGPEQRLLELPLSSAFTGGLRGFGEAAFRMANRVPHLNGFLSRGRLLSRIALTPEGIPADEAVDAVQQMIDEGNQIISISFHSPSVEPGHTPYVRDASDLSKFFGWFDAVLGRLRRCGVEPVSCEEVIDSASRLRNTPRAEGTG